MHRACHGALSRQINFTRAAFAWVRRPTHVLHMLAHAHAHSPCWTCNRNPTADALGGRTKFTSAPLVFGCRLHVADLINTSDAPGCQCNASWRRQVKGAMTIWLEEDNMGFSLKYPFYIVFGRQFWSDGPCLRH